MARTPDRFPGSREDEEIILDERNEDPSTLGAIRYVSGSFRMCDVAGPFNPRLGGSLDEEKHTGLRQLIHFIDHGPAQGFASGAFREILPPASPFPTSIIWWANSSKTSKILELSISRNVNQTPSLEEWKMYNVDGNTVISTITDSITYSGIFEISRTRAIS